jgi:catechol 2,3-dioxygenase-like lactoylglutathione lyase family enzyme
VENSDTLMVVASCRQHHIAALVGTAGSRIQRPFFILRHMLTAIHPKLPMRDKSKTRSYYIDQLGFRIVGSAEHDNYLIVAKEGIEIHFFLFKDLDPLQNYGQVYIRSNDIEADYESMQQTAAGIHPNGALQARPWGQREFHMLDPDHNLLTFGQRMD